MGGLATDAVPVARDDERVDAGAQRRGYGDVHGSDGLAVLLVGARDTGRGDSDIGGDPVAAEHVAYTARHLSGDAGVYGAVGVEERLIDAQHTVLQVGRVRDHSPAYRTRGTRNVDQGRDDEPPGEGLGDRDRPAELFEPLEEEPGAFPGRSHNGFVEVVGDAVDHRLPRFREARTSVTM